MKKRVCLFLSLLLLFSMLPGGAMAYGREAPGPGPAAAVALGDCYFYVDTDGEVVVRSMKHWERGGVIPGLGDAIRGKWISPAYLSAHDDGKGGVVLTVEDIFTPSMTLTRTVSPQQLETILQGEARNRQDWTENATDGRVSLVLEQGIWNYGWEESEVLLRAPCADGQLTGGQSLVQGYPWGEYLTLYPYNGKTFLLHDKGNLTLYASEDGETWTSLAGTVMAPQEMESTREVRGEYTLLWTGEEYLSCRRVVQEHYAMMGAAGGVWYDPYSTQVVVLNEDFTLQHTYDFGRQVEKVGCYGGVYYAQVADGEGVSVREYDPKGPATLYRSTDGGKTWEETEILQILEALKALQ